MKYKVTLNDKVYEVAVEQGEAVMVNVSDAVAAAPAAVIPAAPVPVAAAPAPAPAAPAVAVSGEIIPSPLPGTVVVIKVAPGDSVKTGQSLAIVEAMKMENDIKSPRDGIVGQIIAVKGSTVPTGAPLLTLQ
ncbi:MAG: acetyl-CoA carboxylase biotin carboxyl carrier protein subunit [Oscillospiraceae bacterium]|nr:acetyl-CoA carboxylase biotin carboxyl carrier protein subunit [Oscillospiraceae bacterium]